MWLIKKLKIMKNSNYSAFVFYNKNKQRLSIFAFEEGDKLKITVIPCSKEDMFCKRIGRKLHAQIIEDLKLKNETDLTYETFEIPIEENKPKMTFLRWCNKNFYKLKNQTITFREQYLIKDGVLGSVISYKISKNPIINKLSYK